MMEDGYINEYTVNLTCPTCGREHRNIKVEEFVCECGTKITPSDDWEFEVVKPKKHEKLKTFIPDPFNNPRCFGCGISHVGGLSRCEECTFWEDYWRGQGYIVKDGKIVGKKEGED